MIIKLPLYTKINFSKKLRPFSKKFRIQLEPLFNPLNRRVKHKFNFLVIKYGWSKFYYRSSINYRKFIKNFSVKPERFLDEIPVIRHDYIYSKYKMLKLTKNLFKFFKFSLIKISPFNNNFYYLNYKAIQINSLNLLKKLRKMKRLSSLKKKRIRRLKVRRKYIFFSELSNGLSSVKSLKIDNKKKRFSIRNFWLRGYYRKFYLQLMQYSKNNVLYKKTSYYISILEKNLKIKSNLHFIFYYYQLYLLKIFSKSKLNKFNNSSFLINNSNKKIVVCLSSKDLFKYICICYFGVFCVDIIYLEYLKYARAKTLTDLERDKIGKNLEKYKKNLDITNVRARNKSIKRFKGYLQTRFLRKVSQKKFVADRLLHLARYLKYKKKLESTQLKKKLALHEAKLLLNKAELQKKKRVFVKDFFSILKKTEFFYFKERFSKFDKFTKSFFIDLLKNCIVSSKKKFFNNFCKLIPLKFYLFKEKLLPYESRIILKIFEKNIIQYNYKTFLLNSKISSFREHLDSIDFNTNYNFKKFCEEIDDYNFSLKSDYKHFKNFYHYEGFYLSRLNKIIPKKFIPKKISFSLSNIFSWYPLWISNKTVRVKYLQQGAYAFKVGLFFFNYSINFYLFFKLNYIFINHFFYIIHQKFRKLSSILHLKGFEFCYDLIKWRDNTRYDIGINPRLFVKTFNNRIKKGLELQKLLKI